MKNLQSSRYQKKLDHLFQQAKGLDDDAEILSHWARYLCVLVSGFLEVSVREIFSEYANKASNAAVARFVRHHLEDFRNPRMEKILQIVGTFNPQWRKDLEEETAGELRDAIDAIVDNRNNIAHGQDVGLTFARIKEFYDRAVKVVNLIEKKCNA